MHTPHGAALPLLQAVRLIFMSGAVGKLYALRVPAIYAKATSASFDNIDKQKTWN